MSSTIRSVASRRIPDENSSTKQVWLFFASDDYNYPTFDSWNDEETGDFIPNLLKFSCEDGVFEFKSDSWDNYKTIDQVYDNYQLMSYPYPCKFNGGLRAVSSFGPEFQKFLAIYLDSRGLIDTPYSFTIINPGKASRVQMDTSTFLNASNYAYTFYNGNSNYWNQPQNAPAFGPTNGYDYTQYQISEMIKNQPTLETWVIREPVVFNINADGTDYLYSLSMPIGDDVVFAQTYWDLIAWNRESNPTNARSITPGAAAPAPVVRGRNVMIRPLNKAAAKKMGEVETARAIKAAEKAAAKAAAAAATTPSV